MERLQAPAAEIAETTILAEQAQEGRLDPDTGQIQVEPAYAGKRQALITRQIKELPVWSSSMLLGLNWDKSIGFLQLHWPEIPNEVLGRARKLQATVRQGWKPPDREGAKVESVEAGIIHSPAIGFVMDVEPAIRVIYAPTDESFGKKPVLYLDENGADVPIPRQFEKFEEPPIDKRPELPDRDRVKEARAQFKSLLLANPNYFGTLGDLGPKPELVINGDTAYEEIGCIGYEPELKRLEAVVYVKQEFGYGGGVCSPGTPEYVRFYLSFDGGTTWVDQGMGSFTAYDIPGSKPLEYDVTVHIDPSSAWCFFEVLPLARAILAWNDPPPPNTPNHIPVWGEVQEAQIQVAPRHFFLVGDLLKELDVELSPDLAQVVSASKSVDTNKPKALTVPELHALYKDTDVPGHRFLHTTLEAQIASPAPAAVLKSPLSSLFADLDIDLAAVIGAFFKTDGDTSFEELNCVGLNPVESALIGTLTVKKSAGFNGGLCTAGSKEYVAFWIDYGSGFTYAGTTSVDVHDIIGIGPNGIEYAVFLPVDLTTHQKPCDAGPVTARVRAILSWQTPPPWWNPNFIPHWGNREETTIHIKPGPTVQAQVPFLSRLGDVPEQFISTSGKATGSTIQTGFVASDSPFGGDITIAGHIANAIPGQKYRIMRKLHGAPDTSYLPITDEPGGLSLTLSTWDSINGWQQFDSGLPRRPAGLLRLPGLLVEPQRGRRPDAAVVLDRRPSTG